MMRLWDTQEVFFNGKSGVTGSSTHKGRNASCKKANNVDFRDPLSSRAVNPPTRTFEVFGYTKKGDACKRCMMQQTFCYQHAPNPPSRTFEVFGYTKKGDACKRCTMQQKFCYQHTSQDPSSARSSNSKKTKTAERRGESSNHSHSNRLYGWIGKGGGCTPCIVQDKFCSEAVSPSPSAPYAPEYDSRATARSQQSAKTFDTDTTDRSSRCVQNKNQKEPRISSSKQKDHCSKVPTKASDCSECAICMEKVKFHQKYDKVRCCGKKFHSNCIGQWLQNKSTCPMCRELLL